MFAVDSLVFDLIFPATARPTPEQVNEGLGGEEVAQSRMIVDIDLDLPQIEAEISPTFLLRKRGERRVWIVDEQAGPLRQSPRSQPIVSRDLRPERERLVAVVEKTGARLGRLGAFGAWGDAVIVGRSARDLRALALLSWALDPTVDLDGRRRATPLSQREFEMKLSSFDKRLDELDDAAILARFPPGTLATRGRKEAPLYVVSVISDRDGSWDVRKSYELEKRVGAVELFSRIPGARQTLIADEPTPRPAAPAAAKAAPGAKPDRAPEPAPPPEPPRPAGPPISAVDDGGRVILRIPGDRLDNEALTALGKRLLDVLAAGDQVTRQQRHALEQSGGGFVAPLAFLSEVFLEGRPLDKKRFLELSQETDGARVLEALLPRVGAVWVVELDGKRWLTSEIGKLDVLRRIVGGWA
jgi:hypothetical protein